MSLDVGILAVGFIVGLKGVGQVLSDIPGGFFLNRWDLRIVTIIFFSVAIVVNGLLAIVTEPLVIAVLIFLSGFFTSILITTAMTLLRAIVPPHLRGRAMAGVGGSMRAGTFFGPAVGGVLADQLGMPIVFWFRVLVLALGVVSFVYGTKYVKQQAVLSTVPFKESFSIVIGSFRERRRAIVTVGFGILVLSILRSSRDIILPLWGTQLLLSPALIGMAMSIGGLVDTLLFLPAGYISDLYGRKIALGLSLSVLSVGIAAVVSSSTIGLFFLISGLIGLGNGIGAGVFMTTGTDLAPDGAASTFLGFWRFYGDLGNAFGPMLVGVLAAALAIGPAILLTGTIGLAGAATVVLFAPETRDIARNAPRA
jgi:MFS family permease